MSNQDDSLPLTEDDWAKIPRPVPLLPDSLDLYHASHNALMPCPFCGRFPIVHGEVNERTKIIGYRVSCDIVKCGASVFCNSRNRDEARQGAIDKWSKRTAVTKIATI